jgi:aminoglycoside phosphotransferase (APT) family kinase protein
LNDADKQNVINKAGRVRKGEELNLTGLIPWLESNIPSLKGEPTVTQYSGGASNWTYCLSYPTEEGGEGGESAVHEVILRRGPAGTKAKGAHDMGREYRLQTALKPVNAYVPEMLGHCDDESVLGAEFYVMEKLNGLIPRMNLPKVFKLEQGTTSQLCLNALDSLIELHKVDYKAAALDHLTKGEGYTQRQIEGWGARYTKAKTWNVPSAKYVMNWLKNNMPSHEHICLTHNDFRFDNLVLDVNDPTKILGVLDWELATLGNPLMDLGDSLAYWVQADDDKLAKSTRRQPTHLPGMLTRKEMIAYYLDKTDFRVDNFAFYEVYGLFRLAAIAQQIYYRYHHKQTDNPALKHIGVFVHYLLWQCRKAIKGKR